MEIKLLLSEHVERAFEFEKAQLPEDLSEIQVEMSSWEKPWRKESLEHYSQLGWSFVAEAKEGDVLGYVLAQPVLFFNNWTQTLWVEHLSFKEDAIGHQLLDTLIRWSKTKHLQKVIFNSNSDRVAFAQESFPGFKEGGYLHLSTTKLTEA